MNPDDYLSRYRENREKKLLLTERVLEVANEMVEENNYDDPHLAYKQCRIASTNLSQKFEGLVSFLTEVRVERDWEGTPWDNEFPCVWHWVLTIPMVGIVDITGKQFNEKAIRILGNPPNHWTDVKSISGSSVSPDVFEVFSINDTNKEEGDILLGADYAFGKLLNVEQIDFDYRKRAYTGEVVKLSN